MLQSEFQQKMAKEAKEFDILLDEMEERESKDIILADFDDEDPVRDLGKLYFQFSLKDHDSPYCNYILKGYIDYGTSSDSNTRTNNFVNNKISAVYFDPPFPHINMSKNGVFCFGDQHNTILNQTAVEALIII